MASEAPAVIAELRAEFGPDFRLVERLALQTCGALDGASADDYVAATGIDFATVRSVVDRPAWTPEVARSVVDAIPAYVWRDDPRPWIAPRADDSTGLRLAETLASVVAGVPSPRVELDQVQATAATIADRALIAARSLDLVNAHVLFLGDHDLTSVALAELEPSCSLTVVDVDEGLLSYIAEVSPATRTLFCDLRLGLPPQLVGQFDLVVTDPPYSVPGMALFFDRARAALRANTSSRMLVAYGHSSRALGPAREIQQAILARAFLFEAILPGFNRFSGAPAIGMNAELYVARAVSTSRRWHSVADAVDLAVYSKGPNAMNRPAQAGVAEADHDAKTTIRVKPAGESPSPSRVDRLLYDVRPPKLVSGQQNALFIPLDPELAGLAFRLVLAAPPVDSIEIVCAERIGPPLPGIAEVLSARWEWSTHSTDGGEAIRFRTRGEDHNVGVAYLASHSMSRVRNAVVEACIRHAASTGSQLSKREARSWFESMPSMAKFAQDAVVDLPDWALHQLAQLVGATPSRAAEDSVDVTDEIET